MTEETKPEEPAPEAPKVEKKPRKPGKYDRAQPILRHGNYKQVDPRGTVVRTNPKKKMSKKERIRLRKSNAA